MKILDTASACAPCKRRKRWVVSSRRIIRHVLRNCEGRMQKAYDKELGRLSSSFAWVSNVRTVELLTTQTKTNILHLFVLSVFAVASAGLDANWGAKIETLNASQLGVDWEGCPLPSRTGGQRQRSKLNGVVHFDRMPLVVDFTRFESDIEHREPAAVGCCRPSVDYEVSLEFIQNNYRVILLTEWQADIRYRQKHRQTDRQTRASVLLRVGSSLHPMINRGRKNIHRLHSQTHFIFIL